VLDFDIFKHQKQGNLLPSAGLREIYGIICGIKIQQHMEFKKAKFHSSAFVMISLISKNIFYFTKSMSIPR
jgi:hypothetical protein